jgi:hypothetical protein
MRDLQAGRQQPGKLLQRKGVASAYPRASHYDLLKLVNSIVRSFERTQHAYNVYAILHVKYVCFDSVC